MKSETRWAAIRLGVAMLRDNVNDEED